MIDPAGSGHVGEPEQRFERDAADVVECALGELRLEPSNRRVERSRDAESDPAFAGIARQRRRQRIHRPSQGVHIGVGGLFAPNLDGDARATPRAPVSFEPHRPRGGFVAAECHVETEKAAEQQDQILSCTSVLVAERRMRLVEHAADRRDAGHLLEQEAPEALSRRVEAGGVVETTNERQEFRKIQLHHDLPAA